MSIENQYVSFNDDFTDWQYASGVIIPKQRGLMIENITIYCAYDYNANDAYFTNISLVLEPAETYSYDSKGNPIAATDGNAKTASEFFADSQRLKSYTTPGGAKHTLGYDANNNLQSDELAGLTNYTYHNTSGSVTLNMTRKGYSGDYLKSANTYDSTRRFRTQSTDANGVTTKYEYETGAARLFRSAVGKSVDAGKGIIGLYTSVSMEGLASGGRAARQIYQSTRRKRARQRITNHRSLFSRYRNRFSRSKSSWAR